MIEALCHALKETGDGLLDLVGTKATEGVWDGSQLKAKADVMAHDWLSERLVKIDPTIPIISEEDMASHGAQRPDRYWLIDPIDGTRSFCEGFQGYVTQAALMEGNAPTLGAVFAPALGWMYSARKGEGAWCNGQRLTVRGAESSRVLVDNYPEPRGIAKAAFESLAFESYLESGSLGLKICRVADGSATLFLKDVVVRHWDLAPADLILSEAGGCLWGLGGAPIVYKGDFEVIGFVAAASEAEASGCCRWLDEQSQGQNLVGEKTL